MFKKKESISFTITVFHKDLYIMISTVIRNNIYINLRIDNKMSNWKAHGAHFKL